MSRVAGKRGRRQAVHAPELMLHNFRGRMRFRGRAAPPTGDVTQGLISFGMLGNNTYSNCGPAAVEHIRMLKALTGPGIFTPGFIAPTDANTEQLYFELGVAMGEPPPNPDQGVVNSQMLSWLYTQTQGKLPKGDDVQEWAFAEVDVNDWNEVCCAMLDFHGVLIGQALPDNAESDFQAEPPIPWTIDANNPPDPNEGHDTVYAKYDTTTSPKTGDMITWGGLQPFIVPDYEAGEVTAGDFEAWVIITQEDVDSGLMTQDQFNALKAEIATYANSQVSPVTPEPVQPTPTPEPPAPVTPTPEPDVIQTFVQRAEAVVDDAAAKLKQLFNDFVQAVTK